MTHADTINARPARAHATAAWAAAIMGGTLPISTAGDNLMLALVVLAWIFCGDWRGKWQRVAANPPSLAALAFVALAALGTFWGLGSGAARLHYFGKYADLALVALLVSLPLTTGEKRRALAGFALSMGITLLLSYGLKLGLIPLAWLPEGRTPDNPTIFKLHITHGMFMALASLLYLVYAQEASDRRWRLLWSAAALLAAANVLMTQGRTGHLALLAIAGYLGFRRFRSRFTALAVIAALLALGAVSLFPESAALSRLQTGIQEIRDWQPGQPDLASSMGTRMQYYATTLEIIADHPLAGVGTGGFANAYQDKTVGTQIPPSNNPHNQYLLALAQFGPVGLIVLLAIFVVAWRTARRLPPSEALLAKGFLIAFAIGNAFNSFLLDHAEALMFAWMLGVLYSGLRRPDQMRTT
ncbi:MAG: O-antigen ligase family protein [Candidatus Accumulibacter sp.]|nr:O-antigen ligase family protein [Accumulibacter sp.]